jgi:hypothetical protein
MPHPFAIARRGGGRTVRGRSLDGYDFDFRGGEKIRSRRFPIPRLYNPAFVAGPWQFRK